MHSSQEKKNYARNHREKAKLVQRYQNDLMLLRRTHDGCAKWYKEQSIHDEKRD